MSILVMENIVISNEFKKDFLVFFKRFSVKQAILCVPKTRTLEDSIRKRPFDPIDFSFLFVHLHFTYDFILKKDVSFARS